MLSIVLVMIIPLLLVNVAYADQFQITDSNSGFDASYSRVYIADVKFEGFTDKFGRITIDILKGNYRAIVNYRDIERIMTLNIDGSQFLKTIDIAKLTDNIIYIQYNDEKGAKIAKELQLALKKEGLNAPGIEKVAKKYANSVRFFYAEDQSLAVSVRNVVELFFKKKGYGKSFRIEDISKSDIAKKAQKRQIEIWIDV